MTGNERRADGYVCPVCGAFYNMYCSMCRQYEIANFIIPSDFVYVSYEMVAPTKPSKTGDTY